MTINKAEWQTLRLVGKYIPSPGFSHNQLFLVFSRTSLFDITVALFLKLFLQRIEKS
jgi:hypothetical protein